MNTPVIRPAGPNEATLISSLATRIWPVCYSGILSEAQIANMLKHIYSPASLARQMEECQRFWIMRDEQGNHAHGFIAVLPEKNNGLLLKKLYLLPELQGKGHGSSLLSFALQAFPDAHGVRLYVNRDNLAAQRFYARRGFRVTGEEPVRMGEYDFVDLVMYKPLVLL